MGSDIIKRLVENALDFLHRAIDDLEGHPKHSVIGFYTGVELFLKARLLAEHWSLVVSPRKDPDFEAFLKGNFVSVSLEEAASRLEKAVRSGLSPGELQTFKRVGQHRNKMVHFFSRGCIGGAKDRVSSTSPQRAVERLACSEPIDIRSLE